MPAPTSCIDCMNDDGLGAAPSPPVMPAGHAVTAIYPGRCPYCDDPIHPGDQITPMSDDTWRHEGCW